MLKVAVILEASDSIILLLGSWRRLLSICPQHLQVTKAPCSGLRNASSPWYTAKNKRTSINAYVVDHLEGTDHPSVKAVTSSSYHTAPHIYTEPTRRALLTFDRGNFTKPLSTMSFLIIVKCPGIKASTMGGFICLHFIEKIRIFFLKLL